MVKKKETLETGLGNTKKPLKQPNQLKNWFFTWNNYPKDAIALLETRLNQICEKFVFQEEIGAIEGTPHLQGSIVLYKKMRWSEFKLPKEINWRRTKYVDKSFAYCCKEWTKNGKCIMKGYKIKKKLRTNITELYEWEEFIIALCEMEPDERSIWWFYDKEGGAGKTEFTKWYWNEYKEKCLVCCGGGAKDIACMFSIQEKENSFDLNDDIVCIFNLTRSTEGISYKAIECVKDGMLFSPKYESNCLIFNHPHVIIFSNQLPDVSKLSEDRWNIYRLLKGGGLVEIDAYDVEIKKKREEEMYRIEF